jgi:hypothetical protein
MATTAQVLLRDVHIHQVADPTQVLKLHADKIDVSTTGPADARIYGQGNVRDRSTPGVLETLDCSFDMVMREHREMLEEWVKAHLFLFLRDPRGRVRFGKFAHKSIHVSEMSAEGMAMIEGSFQVVTPPPDPVP